jgi:hypothetical protein
MGFILNLSGWKVLHENERAEAKIFFHFRQPDSKYASLSFTDNREAIYKRVKSFYPEAEFIPAARLIRIPNKKFQEESDEPQIFTLDLDTIPITVRKSLHMPRLLMETMQKFSIESSYSEKGVFWIESKPEYARLSADEFKKLVIDTIKKEYEILDSADFAKDLELHFSMVEMGSKYGLYDEQKAKEFMNDLARNEEVMYSLEQIEKTPIYRTLFDSEKIKAEFNLKKKDLMTDYSGFSREDLDKIAKSILSYLGYLGNILGSQGPEMDKIVEADLIQLIRHFNKYPELWQRLEALS